MSVSTSVVACECFLCCILTEACKRNLNISVYKLGFFSHLQSIFKSQDVAFGRILKGT